MSKRFGDNVIGTLARILSGAVVELAAVRVWKKL
jgi:hypothetical protein